MYRHDKRFKADLNHTLDYNGLIYIEARAE